MKLSKEEREKRGRELAGAIEERTGIEDEKKEAVAKYKKRLDVIDHRIGRLAWAVNTGLMPEEERQMGLGIDAE